MTDVNARRRPTISDVAAAAGVSTATVSRALNGDRWVSDAAARAVAAAVEATGYRVNQHARSLKTQRSGTVAFLLGSNIDRLFADPNLATLLRVTSGALADADLSMIVLLAETPADAQRAASIALSGNVDGVILAHWYHHDDTLTQLVAAQLPIVSSGPPPMNLPGIGSVSAGDFDGARQIVAHLHEQGRSRIAYIAGPADEDRVDQRLAGYRSAMAADFDESLVMHGDWTRASGERQARHLLERDSAIDAIFAGNDIMARGAIDAAIERGHEIPRTLAVAGFDDSPPATSERPQLTTIQLPVVRGSREMVRLLQAQIAGEAPAAVTFPGVLVVRETT